jgi:hypothetical protein
VRLAALLLMPCGPDALWIRGVRNTSFMDEHQPYNEELDRALEAFVSSSRFNFLKRLQIGRLIGGDADSLGQLADLTFEALVQLGTDKLQALSVVQKRVLVSTLFALSEGGSNGASGDDESEKPAINSVQAEIDLREKIRALEAHPEFQANKNQKLGAFWDPEWERAPFEEAFTLAQLVTMDLSTLQKKRSVGPSRVVLLTQAVERIVASLSGVNLESASKKGGRSKAAASSSSPRSVALPVEEPRLHPWMLESSAFSIAEVALLEHLLECIARPEIVHSIRGPLVSSLAAIFSASDIILVAQLEEPPKQLLKKLKNWIAPVAEDPQILMLKEALQGPGVHFDKIVSLLSLNDWSPSLGRLLAVFILRALGAQPIKYQGRECSLVYSLNPGLAQLIVGGLKGSSKSTAALSNLLKATCPAMDPFLHEWLCQAVKSSKRR